MHFGVSREREVMGSEVGVKKEEKRGRIEGKVGGLVWVQRKNGCWWPGQIIGLDELSQNGDAYASPRPGTPIKLLGRDDFTVDWYDLETTKIVKAFRCGEYDTCIENAKLTAAKFLKRSLRYPRREIAIYRALEIEKNSKDGSKSSDNHDNENQGNCENGSACLSRPPKNSDSSFEETSSEYTVGPSEGNSHSTQELSHSGISYEETNGFACLKRQPSKGKRRKTPNDSEDDGNEGFKRMKGLNDLGAGSEQKRIHVLALTSTAPQSSISLNGTRSNTMAVEYVANGGNVPMFKKKRSQVVHIHELLKRKCPQRPITKVLENTAMVPVRIICDEFTNPFERSDAISPVFESEDSDKVKDAELLNKHLPEVDSSDALFDVPFSDEELHLSDISPVWQPSFTLKACGGSLKGNPNCNFRIQGLSTEHEALDEPGPSYFVNRRSLKVEKSASIWQSKGKRNARFISKNDESLSYLRKSYAGHGNLDADAMSLDNPSRFSPSSNGLLNGFTDFRRDMMVSTSSQRSFSYHEPHFLLHSDSELPDVLSLYEVEVTVEATRHQTPHVPYLSLVSKLSGKPITGHPLTVELLEDGFCDLQTFGYPASESCELDDEDADMDFVIQPNASKTKHIKLQPRFSHRKVKSSHRKGKSSKSKKRCRSSSKNTKKLSSLTGLHRSAGKRKPVVQGSNGPTTLACVPLKLVFSRINEVLNGSSRATAHHAVTLNST